MKNQNPEQSRNAGSPQTGNPTSPAPMPAPREDLISKQSEPSLSTTGSLAEMPAQTGRQLSETGCVQSALTLAETRTEAEAQALALRAMNALSWLHTSKTSGNRIEAIPTGCEGRTEIRLRIDLSGVKTSHLAALEELCPPAEAKDVTLAISRLMIHRRKAGLAETTLPAFMADIVADVLSECPSVLALQIAMQTLRRYASSDFFPSTPELIQHITEADYQLRFALLTARARAKGEKK